jgi:hypothetical protein
MNRHVTHKLRRKGYETFEFVTLLLGAFAILFEFGDYRFGVGGPGLAHHSVHRFSYGHGFWFIGLGYRTNEQKAR